MSSKIIVLSSNGIAANIAANSGPPRPTNIQTANANTTVAHNFTAGTLPTRYMLYSGQYGNMPISNSTSTNGVTWTAPASITGTEVINFAIVFNKTASAHTRATSGNFDRIVIGGGDTGPTTARSKGAISYNEGRNWYPITFPNDNPITTIAWGKTGPGNSLFMGTSYWEGNYIYTSQDGVSWSMVNSSISNASSNRRPGAILWDGKKWVLTCGSTTGALLTEFGKSYDNGVTWTFNTIDTNIPSSSAATCIAFGKGKYVVGGQYGRIYSSSDDGDTWSLETTMGAQIRNLKYFSGANGGVFICCIEAKNVYYSFDATTWTSMSTTNITTGPIIDVEFGGNHFVALESDTGGYSNTYTIPSVTSASWTKRLTATGASSNYYFDSIIKHRNTTVVNQGINSVSGNVWLTHADVRSGWQRITRTSPARIFQSQQWHNYRNECFLVPVHNTNTVWTNTSFMITTTGVVNVNSYWVTLDAGTSASTNNFDTAGLMTILVTGDGRIYRNSSNVFSDVDWTLSLNDGTSQAFNDVKYIPRYKKWIAVGTDKIYTSPDGINWQRRQYDFSGNAHKIEDNGYRTVIIVELTGAVWVTLDGNYFKGYTSAQTGLTTGYDDRIMYSPRHSQFITDIANFSPDGLPTPWTSAGITRTRAGGIGETRNAIFIGSEVSGPSPAILCNITTGANGSSDLLDSGYRTVPFVSPTGGILVSGATGFLP